MSAYDQTKQIIQDTLAEFGAQAHGIETIIVDRIKDSGLKIEPRANAKRVTAKADANKNVTLKATSNKNVTLKDDTPKSEKD